jgi:hypothetical protein
VTSYHCLSLQPLAFSTSATLGTASQRYTTSGRHPLPQNAPSSKVIFRMGSSVHIQQLNNMDCEEAHSTSHKLENV